MVQEAANQQAIVWAFGLHVFHGLLVSKVCEEGTRDREGHGRCEICLEAPTHFFCVCVCVCVFLYIFWGVGLGIYFFVFVEKAKCRDEKQGKLKEHENVSFLSICWRKLNGIDRSKSYIESSECAWKG